MQIIHTLRFSAIVIGSILLCSACSNSSRQPGDAAANTSTQKPVIKDTTTIGADVRFLDEAADIYQEEIKLGELAHRKGKLADVKALGYMMETAHAHSLDDLNALAFKKNITISKEPSTELKESYRVLDEMPVNEFDKAYCLKLEAAHNRAIEVFRRASRECVDTDIKNMAGGMLSDFDAHLYHIVACLNKLDAKTK